MSVEDKGKETSAHGSRGSQSQHQHSQGWKCQRQAARPISPRSLLGLNRAHVADIPPSVIGGITVHDFFIVTGSRNTDPVIFPDERSKVIDEDQIFLRVL